MDREKAKAPGATDAFGTSTHPSRKVNYIVDEAANRQSRLRLWQVDRAVERRREVQLRDFSYADLLPQSVRELLAER